MPNPNGQRTVREFRWHNDSDKGQGIMPNVVINRGKDDDSEAKVVVRICLIKKYCNQTWLFVSRV